MAQNKPATPPAFEPVVVRTAAGRVFAAYVGHNGVWSAADLVVRPPCWTDGICWQSNEDGEPSDPVVAWWPMNG